MQKRSITKYKITRTRSYPGHPRQNATAQQQTAHAAHCTALHICIYIICANIQRVACSGSSSNQNISSSCRTLTLRQQRIRRLSRQSGLGSGVSQGAKPKAPKIRQKQQAHLVA
jgi:hypothetical protein